MRYKKILNVSFTMLTIISNCKSQETPVYSNKAFTVYADRIVQGNFVAKAASVTEISSNYQSPANKFQSAALTFKFSINLKDNEMKPGSDHHFNCISKSGACETPVIKFGEQLVDKSTIAESAYLLPDTRLLVRLDMREVLNAFKKDGYFTTYNGNKIYAADFKGVYVAGATEPMTWDFDNLHQRPQLQLTDPDGDGIFQTSMILNETKKEQDLASSWKLSKDISAFPQYHSGYTISDAIYNMALEEMERAVEPDSTFRTGKEWAGVWTRDISYSIILSMAYLQPKVAMYSLMKKVKKGKIIQDTGTGGAYPNSTDRMIWAVAAWELYKATGDEDWLKQAYTIIKNSADDDLQNAHDNITGMVRGESSFLDWREQTYPKWMQPADIFESECLGTNAVHFQSNMVLSEMASVLQNEADSKKYLAVAERIKQGINKYLWMTATGYYGQYLYGNHYKILSPKSEALGEALCILFDIAGEEQKKSIIANTPVTAFGVPCIYPQIRNIPPYHNNAVWPFVQSYWALAAAKAGNETSLLQSIGAIYRPASLFLTNKENFVADNGDYKGTQINSSNMLWSLSGSIAIIHKIIFGIHFEKSGLLFKPFVPYALRGERSLENFRYRKSILNIEVEGYGNVIKSFAVDGKISGSAFISSNLEGKHNIKIVLTNTRPEGQTNEAENHTAPETPMPVFENNSISWPEIKGVHEYKVLVNGKIISSSNQANMAIRDTAPGIYQVIGVDEKGYESFASEPLFKFPAAYITTYEAENFTAPAELPYKGFSGNGFAEISTKKNKTLSIPININSDGIYAIDFRYANGNGPTNTENKCAIRTLKNGTVKLGTIIFPQRGSNEWSNWGFSNPVQASLRKGKHTINLTLEPANENMNGEINQAMVDYVRVIKIGD